MQQMPFNQVAIYQMPDNQLPVWQMLAKESRSNGKGAGELTLRWKPQHTRFKLIIASQGHVGKSAGWACEHEQ